MVESIVEKGENADFNTHFPMFSIIFSKGFFLMVVKKCH